MIREFEQPWAPTATPALTRRRTTVTTVTITSTGVYDITAYGGQGGQGFVGSGGDGAEISGTVELTAGEVLKIVVGGAGGNGASLGSGAGGGGGSFVLVGNGDGTYTPLLVAGGGGGGGLGLAGGSAETGPGGGNGTGNGGAGSHYGYGGGFNGGGGGGSLGGYGGNGGAFTYGTNGGTGNAYAAGQGAYSYNGGGFGGGGGGGEGGGGGGGGFGGGGGGGGGDYYSGGGGGSYVASTVTELVDTAAHTGGGEVILTQDTICYLRGTHILTPTGEVCVEDLRIGDAVVTRFGGIRPIRWIGRQSFAALFIRENRARLPVCIRAGALGDRTPARDLYVSPGHSMLLGDTLVLAEGLVNGVTITQDWCPAETHYYQLDLGTHDCVIAEGTWSETFADAPGLRAIFHNAAEFETLYPEALPAEELALCTSRPERGRALDAALRPIVARASAPLTPGPLRGWVDAGGRRSPRRRLGHGHFPPRTACPARSPCRASACSAACLACDYRADLQDAGLARGHCSFVFTAPVKLDGELLATLGVRRASDGARLAMTEACVARLGGTPYTGLRAVG